MVQSVSLSPDRRLLAVAAADGTLRLWDVASPGHPVPVGAPLEEASDSPLYATAFSPDGKILAAAGAAPDRPAVGREPNGASGAPRHA